MDWRAEAARLRRENQTLQQQLAATQAANHTLRERVRLLEQDNQTLRTQNAAVTAQLQPLHEQCQTTQAQLTTVQQQLAALDLPAARSPFKAKTPRGPRPPAANGPLSTTRRGAANRPRKWSSMPWTSVLIVGMRCAARVSPGGAR